LDLAAKTTSDGVNRDNKGETRMKLKRMLAAFLAAASLSVLLVGPAVAAAPSQGGFLDVSDPSVLQAVETLRLLGIVGGDGNGKFYPNNTLTRAEFCKMAVEILGKGAEAQAQMNRTIFKDVLPTHWARGYINLAASIPVGGTGGKVGDETETKGSDMLMVGRGDSRFYPNDTITYAEAVSIMLRLLGYSSKSLSMGGAWYTGALSTGESIGLTDGLTLAWNDQISRGKTAILFENMLFTSKKDDKNQPYLVSTLGGKLIKDAVILSLDGTASDGSTGAVVLAGEDGTYKSAHTALPSALEGSRVQIALDKNGYVVAVKSSAGGTQRAVSIVTTQATYFTIAGGEQINISPDAVVYADKKASTYKAEYLDIKPSTQAILRYAASGKLEYLFLKSSSMAETALVAKATGGNAYASLVGSDSYRIVKNGLSASISDIREYDVGTYDKSTKTLYVSDLRVTGVYSNVSPSPTTPLKVTVLGADFAVLPSAFEDLSKFKIGDTLTLLLTADSRVAGAVSTSAARSTAVGIVKTDGDDATVTPLADLRDASNKRVTFTGKTNLSKTSAAELQGQLVTVSSSRVGELTVSRLSSSGASGVLDVNARTLGGAALAENVRLYDRVSNGAPKAITLANLTRSTISASSISYVGKDYAGRVSVVVFNDVTGDLYTYGLSKLTEISDGYFGNSEIKNGAVSVATSGGKEVGPFITGAAMKDKSFIGIAPSLEKISDHNKLAGWVSLQSVTKVPRSAFTVSKNTLPGDENTVSAPIGTVSTSSMILPIAGDVACYNSFTKTWFASLDEARAYSDSLTIYYDKSPQEGGKVRIVVVE
jgi:hypothetical protein